MRILSVAGSRGERVKLAPVLACLERGHERTCAYVSCHGHVPTWDTGAPVPDLVLEIGEPTPILRAGAVLRWMEPIIELHRPEIVLTCGGSDANVGCALAASLAGIPLAHLDAGVGAGDADPNSALLDQASVFLMAPHAAAVERLVARGMADSACMCGDTLAEAVTLDDRAVGDSPERYCLCYLAGAAVESPALPALLGALTALELPVVIPAGRLARTRIETALREAKGPSRLDVAANAGHLMRLVEPMDYAPMQMAVAQAAFVITDSPTLQRECYFRRTIALGLVPADFPDAELSGWVRPVTPDADSILNAVRAPAPEQAPELEAHRGAGERAARFIIGL